ncbi:MAG: SMC-Scp complex subunit ScpB [Thermomicrobiales bacterium]
MNSDQELFDEDVIVLRRAPAAQDKVTDERPLDIAPSQQSMPLPIDEAELGALVEALLLVSPAATTIEELAVGAGVPSEAVELAISAIDTDRTRGWFIQRHAGKLQLATSPRFAIQVRRFLGLDREAKLSGAALETVAIVAYQQPVTRSEIEAVRGVDCSGVLATLHHRGLIEQVGRISAAGNPIQYGTTPDFLLHFGLASLADLPPLGTVDGKDARSALASAVADAAFMPGAESPEVDGASG